MTSEANVFNKHYAKLCSTLTDIDELLPHFVAEKIISINVMDEINDYGSSRRKVQKLISHISGPLTAGNTKGFYIMLGIMEEHGHDATQQLASQIKDSLTITDDKRSNHCSK